MAIRVRDVESGVESGRIVDGVSASVRAREPTDGVSAAVFGRRDLYLMGHF